MSDNVLKSFKDDTPVLQKLASTFSTWYNHGELPPYMKKSLLTPLSKQDSAYPNVGKIRPIAVLPATFKLYEHLVLQKLEKELSLPHLRLHPYQRGFRPGQTTATNVHDLCTFFRRAKNTATEQRRYIKNPKDRELIYFLSIDFEKAFDRVNRQKLIDKMIARGHS